MANYSFTREQDNAIIYWIKNGGFNNITKSCEDLAQLDLFENKSACAIKLHYYQILKRDHTIFQLGSTESQARVNYKNDPAYWRRAS